MKNYGQTMGVFETNDSSKVAQKLKELGFNVDVVEGRTIYIGPMDVGPSIEKILQLSEFDGYGMFGVSAEGEPATNPQWMIEIDKKKYNGMSGRGYMFGVSAVETNINNWINSMKLREYIQSKKQKVGG